MALFIPRTVYHTHAYRTYAPMNPLYNLLRELDQSVQQPQRSDQCQPQQKSRAQLDQPVYRVSARPWEPRFEAHETGDSFVVYGELPGLTKDHVVVEFPEPRKLVISGNVERFTDATKAAEKTTEKIATAPVVESDREDTRSRSSYQATVEDDLDDDEFEVLSHRSAKSENMSQPESETFSDMAKEEQSEKSEQCEKTQEPRHSGFIKEFSRYFTFPTHVNHEAVTANIKDGLLTIIVPKATLEPRRIVIS